MAGIPFKDAGPKRRLEDLHANELRLRLENAGISYPDDATKKELVKLVRENRL
ncbi:hypothetical protein HF872_09470 [Megasphaera hexanoica]|uniref:HeH/LEM domain-containing protein n=1 Tax=Megasphaera hexanoica TaxID=1675036 RepID=A0A848BUB7_9FIRM|nr:hypothetical protein [Megasphaera hexanoica]NME28845.1 hypothetical protein [Megasphaera hexanoica]